MQLITNLHGLVWDAQFKAVKIVKIYFLFHIYGKRLKCHGFQCKRVQIKDISRVPAGIWMSFAIFFQELNKICSNHSARTVMMGLMGKPQFFVGYNN